MSLPRLRVGQKLVLAMAVTILVSFVVAGVVIQRVAGRHAIKTAEEFSGTVNAQVVGTVEAFAKELELTSELSAPVEF